MDANMISRASHGRTSAGRDRDNHRLGQPTAEVQRGLHEPDRPDDHHVDPVLASQEPLDAADLGFGEHVRHSAHRLTAKPLCTLAKDRTQTRSLRVQGLADFRHTHTPASRPSEAP